MDLNLTITNTATKSLFNFARELPGKKAMFEIGAQAKALIATRTLRGRDVHGTPFTSYSTEPMYASATKRPAGYPAPSGGRPTKSGKSVFYAGGYAQYKSGIGRPSFVQLSIANGMIGDLQLGTPSSTEVDLFVGGALSANKAHGHQTGANNLPVREWFGLDDSVDGRTVAGRLLAELKATARQSRLEIQGGIA